MLLTMHMLEYQMSFSWPMKRNRGTFADGGLRGVKLWREEDIQKDILYLITPEQIQRAGELTTGCHLLCPAPPGAEGLKGARNCLYTDAPVDPAALFNAAQDVFLRFSAWLADVDRSLQESRSPSLVLERSARYFGMPLCLVDDEYTVLAFGGLETLDRFTFKEAERLPLDSVNQLTQEEEYTNIKEHRNAFEYSSDRADEKLLCYNLYLKGAYFARLLGPVPKDIPTEGLGRFLECLGKRLEAFYAARQEREAQKQDREEFRQIILGLLKGENPGQNVVEQALAYRGWRTAQRYLVMRFHFLMDVSMDYYCVQLEQIFPDCAAVLLDGAVYCVNNLSAAGMPEQEFMKDLPVFLRESLCKAGLSNPCTNILWLYQYRLEADAALRMGRKEQDTLWYYRFSDYTMHYIAEAATEKLSAWNLAHPAIRILLDNDEKKQGELLNTLWQYLEQDCNAVETAKTLYLHRSTVIYRIGKIQELTGIHLEDVHERMYLQLSFFLLKQTGEL